MDRRHIFKVLCNDPDKLQELAKEVEAYGEHPNIYGKELCVEFGNNPQASLILELFTKFETHCYYIEWK